MPELPEVTKALWRDWYAMVFQNEPGELRFEQGGHWNKSTWVPSSKWNAVIDIDVNSGEYHIIFEYDALAPGFPLYFWNEN